LLFIVRNLVSGFFYYPSPVTKLNSTQDRRTGTVSLSVSVWLYALVMSMGLSVGPSNVLQVKTKKLLKSVKRRITLFTLIG